MISLSSVVITRNEEKNIKSCLNALTKELSSCELLNDFEIIVVDSNSSDKTIEIASNFKNIIIAKLESSNYYSAAMGRKVGAEIAKNDYILFLDGDIELMQGWLDIAIKIMIETNADGICGDLLDYKYYKNGTLVEKVKRYNVNQMEKARHIGGNILINRDKLITCGNYNPYIINNEEAEMYSRFMNFGFILRIPYIMGVHHTDYVRSKQKIVNTLKMEVKRGRSLAFKNSFKNRSLKHLLWIYKDFFRTTVITILSIIVIPFGFYQPLQALILLLVIHILNFLIYCFKRKSIHFFIDNYLVLKFFIGLFQPSDSFEYTYDFIKN